MVAVSTIENNYVIMLSGQPQSLGILLIFLRPCLDQTAFYNANGIEICIRVLPHDEIGILIAGAPSDMHHDIGSCQGAEFLE